MTPTEALRSEGPGARRVILAAALCVLASGCKEGVAIHIVSPANNKHTSATKVVIEGITSGDVRYVDVEGPGQRPYGVTRDDTGGFETWTSEVHLEPGSNTFTATAHDATGQTSTDIVTVYLEDPFTVLGPGRDMTFTSVRGSTQRPDPVAGYPLTIQGALARWYITGPSWAVFSRTSSVGPATVNVTADAAGLTSGTFIAEVTVTDAESGDSRSFPVSLDNRAAGLTVSPASLSFTIDASTPSSGYSRTLAISDELDGTQPSQSVAWTVQAISAPWLRVSPASGGSSPPSQVTVSLDRAALANAPPGSSTATITLAWQNAQLSNQVKTIPVALQLALPLPYVEFASPYVGIANQPGYLVLRGRNLTTFGSTVTAFVGTTELPGQTTQNDTQLTVNYPALPAGRYPVGIKSSAGVLGTNAELVVLPAPSYAYAAVAATTTRSHLIWDSERQMLYGINPASQLIERYRFSAGSWVTDPYYVVPQVQDAELAPNGRSLIVVSSQAVHDIDLTSATWNAVLRAMNPYSTCSTYMSSLAVANNGRVFIVTDQSSAFCHDYTPSFLYNSLDYSLVTNSYPTGWFLWAGIGGSRDGSRIYVGNNQYDPAPGIAIYDSVTNTLIPNGPAYYPYGISASNNASRVILLGNQVHNRSLANTGNLGTAGGKALASRDSSRAFVYRDDGGQPRLVVFDLNGPLQIGAVYPVLRTINLAEGASTTPGSYYSISMTSTHDDSVVFISGNSKILVVPVNQ